MGVGKGTCPGPELVDKKVPLKTPLRVNGGTQEALVSHFSPLNSALPPRESPVKLEREVFLGPPVPW